MGFDFDQIFWVALFVFCFGYVISAFALRLNRKLAIAIAFLKVLLPALYFVYWFHPIWRALDDVTYFRLGNLLVSRGFNPLTILFTAEGRGLIFSLADGPHILYIWWNLLAEYIFRPVYASPVFLNVGATFVAAYFLMRIARNSGCSETYARGLAIFFLFHWDVLVWSSIDNFKDTLVMTISLWIIYSGLRFFQFRKPRLLISLGASLFAIFWIRYYLPVMILGAFSTWLVFAIRGWKKIPLAFLTLVAAYIIIPRGSIRSFQELAIGGWIMGPLRSLLTPQPWSIMRDFSYLLVPSIFHWLLIVPAFISGFFLFRKNVTFRFAAIFFLEIIFFYGLIVELQGPRERFQVSWVLAWAQFEFFWFLLGAVRRKTAKPPETVMYDRRIPARRRTVPLGPIGHRSR